MLYFFRFLVFAGLITLIYSCKGENSALPILGLPADGRDTAIIPDFHFIDQLGRTVTANDFKGKVYIADFFFTSCPTICPLQTGNMLQIYKHFKDDDRVMFLSHSIDPRHDSVPVLKKYADELGVDHDKWRFITGPKEEIYHQAKAYMSIAAEDADAPGGYTHSGYLLLVDQNRHIRAFADGTKGSSVEELVPKIKLLLNE